MGLKEAWNLLGNVVELPPKLEAEPDISIGKACRPKVRPNVLDGRVDHTTFYIGTAYEPTSAYDEGALPGNGHVWAERNARFCQHRLGAWQGWFSPTPDLSAVECNFHR